MRKLTAYLALSLGSCIPSFAWGPEGHRLVADVAMHQLSAVARHRVQELLSEGSYGWHFVDIPWNSEGFSDSRDCFHPEAQHPASLNDHHNCVADRIELFKKVLANRSLSRAERAEALKFLVHFVADLHQPLHAIAEARGGNNIHVSQFGYTECEGRPCNLHSLWDIGMIEHSHLPEHAYAARLETLISSEHLQRRADGTPQDWANESFRLSHRVWLKDGGAADEPYYRRNLGILDERLALAGLRLATLINDALGR
jgi:hypothetical protein